MSSLDYYVYLSVSTAEFLAHFFPVTLVLFFLLLFASLYSLSQPNARRLAIVAAFLMPAFLPPLALVVGTAFVRPEMTAWEEGKSPPMPWIEGQHIGLAHLLNAAIGPIHLALVIGLGFWARQGWPAVVAAGLWWGWITFCACGVAEMSISGNWL